MNNTTINGMNTSGLDKKRISDTYYERAYPSFLRCTNGLSIVYNHHKEKGTVYHENSKLTKTEAKKRL